MNPSVIDQIDVCWEDEWMKALLGCFVPGVSYILSPEKRRVISVHVICTSLKALVLLGRSWTAFTSAGGSTCAV